DLETDLLVGVRLPDDPPLARVLLGRPPAGEPGEREIESTPEEMYRARLAQEAPREPLEDPIGMRQHPEGALGLAGLVRRVRPVLGERDRMVHLDGHRPDLHRDPELAQQALVLP